MTVPVDPYNFANGATADADQVDARFSPLYAALNRALDVDNMLSAVAEKLGLSDPSVPTVRRGKSIIGTQQGTVSASYTVLSTPDRVSNLVLPSDGLILVAFTAEVQCTNPGSEVGLFLGSNQVRQMYGVETVKFSLPTTGWHIVSMGASVLGPTTLTGSTSGGVATTGQAAGDIMAIHAAAGTYNLEVRYVNNSGAAPGIEAKNRKLFAEARAY